VVDEKGTALDGDQVIALIATSWQKSGRLTSSTIVGTVMSNLGLELYLKSLDLSLERTPVGDRHVSEKMRALESNVGGEQSGHIILKDYATTGDGLIAALQVLEVLVRSGKAMSEVGHVFDTVPQVLKSQRFIKDPLDNEIVLKKIKSVEDKLKGRGRLLVRKSGTEPLIRVMAEGSDEEEVVQEVQGILDVMDQQGRLAAG
ncbi:MAG: phosphoglucosamine mutase, partial [bacterium]|nr:phosphoglucosamine mutase [bacterium]